MTRILILTILIAGCSFEFSQADSTTSWQQHEKALAALDCRIVEWKFVKPGERGVVWPNGGNHADRKPMIPMWRCESRPQDRGLLLEAKEWAERWEAEGDPMHMIGFAPSSFFERCSASGLEVVKAGKGIACVSKDGPTGNEMN